MTVRNRTPRVLPQWMSIAEVARELGISRWTAQRRVRAGSIPGGDRMYAHDRGERWHVDRAVFSQWLHQMHQTGS